MGGSWFAYVIVFFGCFVFLLLIAAATGFLYLVARRRGELKPDNVRVVGLPKAPETSERDDDG